MVQEDVRETGRDYTSLRGALSRAAQKTVFNNSCFQPFIDHPSDDAVRNSCRNGCRDGAVESVLQNPVLCAPKGVTLCRPPGSSIATSSKCREVRSLVSAAVVGNAVRQTRRPSCGTPPFVRPLLIPIFRLAI